MPVKSNYNFVPAPEERQVYKPCWSKNVSHDIPFSDGEHGAIEISIKAETPIFIRNGYSGDTKDTEFCHVNTPTGKRYFIPATSLKGMVRNVLEIFTNSRMKKVNNHRHSVRQIMKPNNYLAEEYYDLKEASERKKIRAGWLVRRGDEYFIHDCGLPYKVRYSDLDNHFSTFPEYTSTFEAQFGERLESNMNNDFSAKTARHKYENILKTLEREHHFEIHPLNGEKEEKWKSIFQHLDYVLFSNKMMSEFVGHIVCTGQASAYPAHETSRKGEYIFKGKKTEVLNSSKNRFKVDESVIENFLFINRDNLSDELDDWSFWKTKIDTGVPIFFRKEENGKRVKVKDFGLTFMYKQPVKNSIIESYPLNTYPFNQDQTSYEKDWAETIFGHIEDDTLKGRVFFPHAFQDIESGVIPTSLPKRKVLLSSPRSSYYPFYLNQNDRGDGKTSAFDNYNHHPSLAGYKKYPIKGFVPHRAYPQESEMLSEFSPLDVNTNFKATIRFHNLRKAEIGALLSAITFHNSNQDNKYAHHLGYAKPLGYGKVRIQVENWSEEKIDQYLKEFEYHLLKNSYANHHRGEAMKEFLAMAADAPQNVIDQLVYPELEDFVQYKGVGHFLHRYAKLTQTNFSLEQKISEHEKIEFARKENLTKQARADRKKQIEAANQALELEQERAKQEKLQALEKADFEALKEETHIDKLETFKKQYPQSKYLSQVDQLIHKLQAHKKEDKLKQAQEEEYFTKSYKWDDVAEWPKKKRKKFKNFEFTATQQKDILAAVRKCFDLEIQQSNPKKNRVFKGKVPPFHKFPWKDIREWLQQEAVKNLYEEINKRLENEKN